MLSVLIVEPDEGLIRPPGEPPAGLEVLRARGIEEALEKLGRNRRIDAVLLLAGRQNREIAESIRDDNPAPPPLLTPIEAPIEGGRVIAGESERELLARIAAALQ